VALSLTVYARGRLRMLATVHLRVLHHTLDPLGIALAGLAVAVLVVLVAVVGARLIRPTSDAAQPGATTGSGTTDP
jgi:hypothetical protein